MIAKGIVEKGLKKTASPSRHSMADLYRNDIARTCTGFFTVPASPDDRFGQLC